MPFHLPAFCKYLRPQRQLHWWSLSNNSKHQRVI
jgi:hypothetical protein